MFFECFVAPPPIDVAHVSDGPLQKWSTNSEVMVHSRWERVKNGIFQNTMIDKVTLEMISSMSGPLKTITIMYLLLLFLFKKCTWIRATNKVVKNT